ncbi:RNA-guided endonuclease TnpB family protein, partial [Ligilactobacillus ruminis]|uniref:RNA-guided endonuclease TnpB family protein n=1 Tax=Ligilactobacillus ruminis TaxID=1623 RepID=UPI0022E4F57E
ALKIEYPWLKQAESTSLQRANRDLDDAFQRFFNPSLQNGFPRFKSKKNTNQSYTSKFVNNNIRIVDAHHIKLPKLGLVYFKAGRILNGKIRAVTVRVNSRKQYQASILVESENQTFKKTKKSVGIDLGLKSLTITSDGQKEDILKVDDRLNKKLRIWERKKSRRYENAKKAMAFDKHDKVLFPRTDLKQFPRYQQAVRTVAKLKKHIAKRRRDNLHKLTTRLVKDYDTIVVENLSVKNMMKNHHLSASIANASCFGHIYELIL